MRRIALLLLRLLRKFTRKLPSPYSIFPHTPIFEFSRSVNESQNLPQEAVSTQTPSQLLSSNYDGLATGISFVFARTPIIYTIFRCGPASSTRITHWFEWGC